MGEHFSGGGLHFPLRTFFTLAELVLEEGQEKRNSRKLLGTLMRKQTHLQPPGCPILPVNSMHQSPSPFCYFYPPFSHYTWPDCPDPDHHLSYPALIFPAFFLSLCYFLSTSVFCTGLPPLPVPLGPSSSPHPRLQMLTLPQLPASSSPSLPLPHRLPTLLRSISVWPRGDGGSGHL